MFPPLTRVASHLTASPERDWYHCEYGDLYVWHEQHNISHFELCYSTQLLYPGHTAKERSIRWHRTANHLEKMCIDSGAPNSFHRQAPTLFACCTAENADALEAFNKVNQYLPLSVIECVTQALTQTDATRTA